MDEPRSPVDHLNGSSGGGRGLPSVFRLSRATVPCGDREEVARLARGVRSLGGNAATASSPLL